MGNDGAQPAAQGASEFLERQSAFSYRCRSCCRCCHGKIIRVGPYEILRLARRLGMTTGDFIAAYTEAGGTTLQRQGPNETCVFLTSNGCGVHEDRPLVCRLYPLGVTIDEEDQEHFFHLEPNPETEGEYGTDATVAEYLESQGSGPYFAAINRYRNVRDRMAAVLRRIMPPDQVESRIAAQRAALLENQTMSDWMDIDAVTARYCERHGQKVPDDVNKLVELHISAIESWLNELTDGSAGGGSASGDG